MINFLRYWVYGLRRSNNVRLYTCYFLTLLLFLGALLSGGFNQSLMDFQGRMNIVGTSSEVQQIARNIDRGFGSKTDAQISKEQRKSIVGSNWFIRLVKKAGRILLISPAKWFRKWVLVRGFLFFGIVSLFYTPIAFREELIINPLRRILRRQEAEAGERRSETEARYGSQTSEAGTSSEQTTTGGESRRGGVSFWRKLLEIEIVGEIISNLLFRKRRK